MTLGLPPKSLLMIPMPKDDSNRANFNLAR